MIHRQKPFPDLNNKIQNSLSAAKIDLVNSEYLSDAEAHIFINYIKAKILRNLHNPHYDTNDLAKSVNLSTTQLNRRLKKISKRSSSKIILFLRMECAKTLIQETSMNIKEIAHKVGYLEQSNFCRCFKKQYHISPLVFRKASNDSDVSNSHDEESVFLISSIHLQRILHQTDQSEWLRQLVKVIALNINNCGFGINELAKEVKETPVQLNERLQQLLNVTTFKLIKYIRLQYAIELLTIGEESIATIAYKTGFFDHSHFCHDFKSVFRCTPSLFRTDQHNSKMKYYITPLL